MPFFSRINSLGTFKDFYLKNIEYNLQEEISERTPDPASLILKHLEIRESLPSFKRFLKCMAPIA